MANFSKINILIKKQYPQLDIEVVRGVGYIYFSGNDGYNIDSIMTHPVTTSTEDVLRMCLSEIDEYTKGQL